MVVAHIARQAVVTHAADQVVIARPAVEQVAAGAAVQAFGGGGVFALGVQGVITRTAVQRVGAAAAVQGVVAVTADQVVVTGAAVQAVGAQFATEGVTPPQGIGQVGSADVDRWCGGAKGFDRGCAAPGHKVVGKVSGAERCLAARAAEEGEDVHLAELAVVVAVYPHFHPVVGG